MEKAIGNNVTWDVEASMEDHGCCEDEPLPPFRHIGREEIEWPPFDQKKQPRPEGRHSTIADGRVASSEGRPSTTTMGANEDVM